MSHWKKAEHPRVDWDKALNRGSQLMILLNEKKYEPSKFFDPNKDIEAYGWAEYKADDPASPEDCTCEVEMLENLGIQRPEGDVFQKWSVNRTLPQPDDKKYQIDDPSAKFDFWMTPNLDAIVVFDTRSPFPKTDHDASRIKEDKTKKLTALSDLAFLGWLKLRKGRNKASGDLKYFIRRKVSNPWTVKICEQVWEMTSDTKGVPVGGVPPKMKKVSLPLDTTEARALLGSPNGIAAGWLLVNHSEAFPNKTVTQVDLFRHTATEDKYPYHLVFHIGDHKTFEFV